MKLERTGRAAWRSVPLMLAGILAGSIFIQPSVAHVTRKLGHLVKHLTPLFVNAGEAAGGALTGSYPNPGIANNAIGSPQLADNSVTSTEIADGGVGSAEIAANAVGSSEVADDSLGGSDVNEASLGTVPNADALDGLDSSEFRVVGRSNSRTGGGGSDFCDPTSLSWTDCLSVSITLPTPSRVLVVATSQWDDNGSAAPNSGGCRIDVDNTTVIGPPSVDVGEATATHTGTGSPGSLAITAVSGVLSAAAHPIDLECYQGTSDVVFHESSIAAVALSDL